MPSLNLRITQRSVASSEGAIALGYAYGQEVTIQVAKDVQPLSAVLIFDGPIMQTGLGTLRNQIRVAGGANTMFSEGVTHTSGNVDNALVLRIDMPSVRPETPVIVTVYARAAVRAVAIKEVPYP